MMWTICLWICLRAREMFRLLYSNLSAFGRNYYCNISAGIGFYDCGKAVNMADMMNIPILGLVENMSYLKCPDCNKEIQVFGESHVEEIAQKHGLNVLVKLPIDLALQKIAIKGL